MAFRRQRSTEVSALHAITDATERRVTELYTKAADQLGSDKAPVRLAGLYALERLAQDNPGQRQTIVDVICAYLQMPYTPPGSPPIEPPTTHPSAASTVQTEGEDGRREREDQQQQRYEKQLQEYEKRAQEQRVRMAAHQILRRHLSPYGPAKRVRWDTRIDLAGAYLVRADFARTDLSLANLAKADLSCAVLAQADLTCADLTEAGLSWANLRMANLIETDLASAKLAGADLEGANLTDADLFRANLTEANLDEADLRGANLANADLAWATLRKTIWTEQTIWPQYLRDEIRAASTEVEIDGMIAFEIRKSLARPGRPDEGAAAQPA